ncbi:MAG: isoaspartyl peptidase/L-asparaginase family protein [Sediminibacterium sp.]
MNRRKFINLSGLGITSFSIPNFIQSTIPTSSIQPIVASTWDAGLRANVAAWDILKNGGKSLDAVEQGVMVTENELNCCVGLGANPDRDGIVTLDASIMDHEFNCGSVAFLERIKHPISVARKVMEKSPHVFLVGAGAQAFALANGFSLESADLSDQAKKNYEVWLKTSNYQPIINVEKHQSATYDDSAFDAPKKLTDGQWNHDTIGMIAMDQFGNLSGSCTTSGAGFKMRGRVGDSPIIGAGLFVDNEIGAATSSGVGEEVIRICGTHTVVEYMRLGYSPEAACKKAVERIVNRDPKKAATLQVGFIAINKKGQHGAYAIQILFVWHRRHVDLFY